MSLRESVQGKQPTVWNEGIVKVYGVWHGGPGNYSPGEVDRDVELFDSMVDARSALIERERHGYGYKQTFNYVNREPDSTFTPCVDSTSKIDIYLSNPTGVDDYEPDAVITFGPRGGVVVHSPGRRHAED